MSPSSVIRVGKLIPRRDEWESTVKEKEKRKKKRKRKKRSRKAKKTEFRFPFDHFLNEGLCVNECPYVCFWQFVV